MNKNIIVILVVVLAAAGAWYGFSQNKNNYEGQDNYTSNVQDYEEENNSTKVDLADDIILPATTPEEIDEATSDEVENEIDTIEAEEEAFENEINELENLNFNF